MLFVSMNSDSLESFGSYLRVANLGDLSFLFVVLLAILLFTCNFFFLRYYDDEITCRYC